MSRPRTGHGLTERQRMIVEVIEESVQRHGYGPTMREMQQQRESAYVFHNELLLPQIPE